MFEETLKKVEELLSLNKSGAAGCAVSSVIDKLSTQQVKFLNKMIKNKDRTRGGRKKSTDFPAFAGKSNFHSGSGSSSHNYR